MESLKYYVLFVYELICFILVGLKEFFERKNTQYTNYFPKKTGKVVLLTGGTRGIGKATVKRLLRCEVTLIIGCRRPEVGKAVVDEARKEGITAGRVNIYTLDTSSLKSVSEFSEKVKQDFDQLHCLINNAGCANKTLTETSDGFECTFATNYLGHFYLTHLLMPLLKRGGKSDEKARIIMVSSVGHSIGRINFKDINNRKLYFQTQAYAQSKLAQVLFTNYLDQLMKKENANVNCYSLHPGVILTEIFDDSPINTLFGMVLPYLLKKPDEGAEVILYTCFCDSLESKGGTYISNCQIQNQCKVAKSYKLQEDFFKFSLDLVKIKEFGVNLQGTVKFNRISVIKIKKVSYRVYFYSD